MLRAMLLFATALLPATSFAQINVPHVFVGFTSATFDGAQGIFTYHGACAAEFPNSRMCMSEEILRSPTTPTGLSGTAWVQPTFVPLATGTGDVRSADASGVAAGASPDDMSCSGWAILSTGLTVDAAGRFSAGAASNVCADARSIACCGPPVVVSEGDLNADGIVNLVDEAIFRRMLAGLTVWLP